MLIRAIKAVLTVDASQFDRALREATGAVKSLGYESERIGGKQSGISKLASNLRENSAAWDDISNKSLLAGGAIAAGLGLATKAAVSWESAFAGVRKTTEATEAQYAELERGLRDLTKVLPATHEEIAGVAEAAGQLGIERENVLEFTRTMIDMGEATNLSADEAATAMARFVNVMGTSQAEFSNIGSAIVALGNNFATTEAEIMAMASRLSGAGRQAKMTEGDVLGIATAMSSVGIEAEAGGTAFSRVIIEMGKAVDTGNDKLETFARTAGMSVEAFSDLWSENAGEAMTRFIEGLGEMQARGESLEPILSELGMTDIRVGDALRRSAASSDLFTEAMRLGNEAYAENIALTEEAAQRYETAESKIAIARNTVKDAAIDIGGALAPFVVSFAEGIASIADGFSKLPTPIQQATAGIGALTGGALLFAGAGIKAARALQETYDAMQKIGAASPKTAGAIKGLGTAVAAIGIAQLAVELTEYTRSARVLSTDIEGLASEMGGLTVKLRDLGPEMANVFGRSSGEIGSWALIREEVVSTDEALSRFAENVKREYADGMFDSVGGFFTAFVRNQGEGSTQLANQIRVLDQALAEMVAAGNAEKAQKSLDALLEAVPAEHLERVRGEFTLTNEALAAHAGAAEEAAISAEEAGFAIGELGVEAGMTADEAQEAADAFKEMLTAITMLGGGVRAEQAALGKVRDTLNDVTEAVKEGNLSWHEKEAMLASISEDYLNLTSIQAENGRGVQDLTATVEQGREAFIKQATAMGYSQEAAEVLADAYGLVPSHVTTLVEAAGVVESTAEVLDLDESIRRLDGKIVTVEEEGADPSKGRVLELDGAIFGLKDKTVEVKEIGSTASGDRVVSLEGKIYRLKGKDVDVNANVSGAGAVDTLRSSIERLSGKWVTVGVNYLQRGQIGLNADGGMWDKSSVGLVRAFADGGRFDGTIGQAWPQVRAYAGPRGLLWGEEGSGPWEAFISGHPAKRSRSRAIADDVVARLGGRIDWVAAYANGGIREVANHHYYQAASSDTPAAGPTYNVDVRLDRDAIRTIREFDDFTRAVEGRVTAGRAR